ncbi:CO(2)-response secreted protease [Citrus sinensis]|uniref:CO(2)-response secreted protease n=2 Tax=Citrus sinensis TaxID=2711 RepID=A0ACB8KEA1_CITSI|nr:CO(2)-response secreted protease [Citrus sinensis]
MVLIVVLIQELVKMTPVCPFAKARPDDASPRKPGENSNKYPAECPFSKARPDDAASRKAVENSAKPQAEHDGDKAKSDSIDSASIPPKCPFGYDAQSFKIGPLSCMICQALLFECSKCTPCSHVYCKACISRFKDCPLCGADIEKIEADTTLQDVVDRFIEGHARIKRSHTNSDKEEDAAGENKKVIYEDVSMERGAFLVQQAMRAFRAQNVESAKSRLSLCTEDIRDQIERMGNTSELCSQLGAVLGMLGDCCRAMGDADAAVAYFADSVEFLMKLPMDDLEIIHTLSVSLNKIGDLKYYGGDLQAARSYYVRSLNVRRDAVKRHSNVPSQVLDVAVSLAKVADVDRSIGNEDVAVDGFQEAIKQLESLTLKPEEAGLEQRVRFLFQLLVPYVVYMGSSSNVGVAELAHLQLLSSIIPSEESDRISLIHHYKHSFKGFSAMLTEKEASVLSGHEKIVSVFPDPILKLHTTRSWDFLEAEAEAKAPTSTWSSHKYHNISSDVIIGIIDTGIWPESPSFKDRGMSEIPSKWKGVCMDSHDFKKSNCNRKLIGARFYSIPLTSNNHNTTRTTLAGSPRDSVGHGTHTASTAAGAHVANASYFGLARGTARGGSPSSRIASYKACSEDGCSGSAILQAMDDAIADGVDIISISIGMSSLFQSDYLNDPIAIGAFHAEQMGVMVICSAGNDGPDPSTVVNTAPWIFTVGASSIDRDFQSTVLLGNGKTIKGSAISLSNLSSSMTYPIAFGKDIAAKFTPVSEARTCRPGSLDPKKVAGKIIVCVDDDPTVPRKIKKLVAEDADAKGLILIDEDYEKHVPFDSGIFPFSEVGSVAGFQIIHYINSTKNPTATILPTVDVPGYKPAPVVAYFSSRGPGELTENILKPDVTAPGVAILAAIVPKANAGSFPIGKKPAGYAITSGTSMACPHVTGAAAFIRSVHRRWSSSIIKSALMTTATVYDNTGKPLKNNAGSTASPHETGVGEISPLKALNPGLVFETTTKDYLRFLCYFGYSEKNIRSMSKYTNFNCPRNSIDNLISNINYPSISISKLDRHRAAETVKRTVTNVGLQNVTYISRVNAPSGLIVKVLPQKLVFAEGVKRMSFSVSFYGKEAAGGYNFGSVTWSDNRHSVQMMFAVNVQ